MKNLTLIILNLLAVAFARPIGFSTTNGVADELDAFKKEVQAQQKDSEARIAELEAQNADLLKQAAAKPAPAEDTSTLSLLCKGAGVDINDVRWRVQSGVDPEQAVQAALSQKKANEEAKQAAKKSSK